MKRLKIASLILAILIILGGCTSTRYLTDPLSIGRHSDMKKHRANNIVGEVFRNIFNMIISEAIDTEYETAQSEREFKRIAIINESPDSLFINMVTDVVWKESGYCDIMGIVLPPGAKQKLLAPYPAAYNAYFRTPFSEEEKLEIRTDGKRRRFGLQPGMTNWLQEK